MKRFHNRWDNPSQRAIQTQQVKSAKNTPRFPLETGGISFNSFPQVAGGFAFLPYAATLCGTQRTENQRYKIAFRLTPTLSRSFVAAPFQLGLVWLSVLSTLPPNPSACLRVGVWDKPWDKFANYFETASSQFHFLSRGQKRVGFEALKRPRWMIKRLIFLFGVYLAK